MKGRFSFFVVVALVAMFVLLSQAQTPQADRSFPQAKTAVEAAIRSLQASTEGRLPILDGFVKPGEQPLERFRQGYYRCTVQVSSTSSGGSVVRAHATITAWYDDGASGKSGYRVLASNGRLESDFLDRLSDALGDKPSSQGTASSASSGATKNEAEPEISAPMPQFPPSSSELMIHSRTPDRSAHAEADKKKAPDSDQEAFDKEAENLEEILRNQAHPQNLVAVKESRTPIFMSPNQGAKILFLADAEDEFEMLDANANWVHVRISGLSRGWIRRSSLEVPQIADSESKLPESSSTSTVAPTNEPFNIENEQTTTFPGDWEPLNGKTVMIVSLRQSGNADKSSQLGFAKSILEKKYAELVQTSSAAAGVVLIFDSSDGGMMAVSRPALELWKAGTLSDQALWRRCYFDPPDMFKGSR